MRCWDNKTRFQMTLILLLIVALVVFVALLAVYVSYALSQEYERCDDLCCVEEARQLLRDYEPVVLVTRKIPELIPGVTGMASPLPGGTMTTAQPVATTPQPGGTMPPG